MAARKTTKAARKKPASSGNVSTPLARDTLIAAVYGEAIERGLSQREALAAAEDVADRLRIGVDIETAKHPFYDLRAEQDYRYPRGKRKTKLHGTAPVMRDPATIDTIVVHQTAVEFGVSERALRKSDGDRELAKARRALDVACHTLAFRDGFFVAAHPLRAFVNHAGRANPRSCGIEIEGRYPGLVDDPNTAAREDLQTTWGGSPTQLTTTTVDAACRAIRWMVEEGKREGITFTRIAPHRLYSSNRRSCPGEEIWQQVVLDFAVAELGLEPVRESPWWQGRPVPKAWDPAGSGKY